MKQQAAPSLFPAPAFSPPHKYNYIPKSICMLVVWDREYFLPETNLQRDEKCLGKPPNLSWAMMTLWNPVTLYNAVWCTSSWRAHQQGSPWGGQLALPTQMTRPLHFQSLGAGDGLICAKKTLLSPSTCTTVSSIKLKNWKQPKYPLIDWLNYGRAILWNTFKC